MPSTRAPHLALCSLALCSLVLCRLAAQGGGAPPDLPVFGVRLPAVDLQRTAEFYRRVAGFTDEHAAAGHVLLRSGPLRLLLEPGEAGPPPAGSARVSLNVRVEDPVAAGELAVACGGALVERAPRPFALGEALPVLDPAGNPLNLVALTAAPVEPGSPPVVFNLGVRVRDLAAAEAFYRALGFAVHSRAFLPATLPLARSGAAPLVLHGGADESAPPGGAALILGARRLAAARGRLPAGASAARTGPLGPSITAADPAGNPVVVVERSPARRVFERLLDLRGEWRGESSRGWSETVRFAWIARGSALAEIDSALSSDPWQSMPTMFAVDGDRVVLTHFCVAGSQPRLVADRLDGDTIHFRFLDATGIASRDDGHMDDVVFHFVDDDRFTARWSWYQDGMSQPMETIRYTRVGRAPGVPNPR